jgi:hypothetical protein
MGASTAKVFSNFMVRSLCARGAARGSSYRTAS